MDSYVYLMAEVGTTYVKVGRTTNVAQRRASVQVGNPRRVVVTSTIKRKNEAEAERCEKEIHAQLAGKAAQSSEWFDDALGEIRELFSIHGEPYAVALGRPKVRHRGRAVSEAVENRYRKFAQQASLRDARSPRKIKASLKVSLPEAEWLASNAHRLLAKYGEMA